MIRIHRKKTLLSIIFAVNISMLVLWHSQKSKKKPIKQHGLITSDSTASNVQQEASSSNTHPISQSRNTSLTLHPDDRDPYIDWQPLAGGKVVELTIRMSVRKKELVHRMLCDLMRLDNFIISSL